MIRIILMMLIAGAFTVMGCSSDNSNKSTADSTDIMMPDTSSSAMGADTTSGAQDSLRDSLNR